MKKGYIILIVLIIFFLLFILGFIAKDIFILKNVKFTRELNIEKGKLLQYLEIYPLRHIWNYDESLIENKLLKIPYIEKVEINKFYPNTLVISVQFRTPIAMIPGDDGRIYVLDKDGVIFRELNKNDQALPFILIQNAKNVKYGIIIGGIYKNAVDILAALNNKYNDIYRSISQISIMRENNYDYEFIVNFKTLRYKLYLKNQIDVDSIIRGLCCSIYSLNKEYTNSNLIYTGNGFFAE